jgi:uncharacterized protein YecE (DUF72 family)
VLPVFPGQSVVLGSVSRGHGPDGRYRDHYSGVTLQRWARKIKLWQREQRQVFVYFDNDQKSAAPADARRLRFLLAGERPSGGCSSQVQPAHTPKHQAFPLRNPLTTCL